ncbi:MAG: alpha-2-macroglobulin family protein ['Candidatus Kapabacteria' thiocyanatum]|uniref:Alpha-2-macroglobulin n=1 Tax=Candidatus Kapaibacterium thiocyanatum TaxID=1895771 RepID=A0A1M3KWN3_9BACT|nr:alpha-2-macroglobulin family protein ['Candidatus Kapabacteria' thiocyanatum]OJX56785.1 MAG: hypothetical protein BGO89_09645 ['Candidatus Kapabacteria' thiocyanatum]
MSLRRSFASLFLSSLILYVVACTSMGNGGVAVNFGDVVQPHQNLMFTFDKDMVPDSLLQRWDTTRYVTFSPDVYGKFKWISSRQLVFSPGTGFLPATAYHAEITERVLDHSAAGTPIPDRRTFDFHTPYLGVERTAALWTKNPADGSVDVQITLRFNYDVNPNDVVPKLHLMRGSASVPFSLVNTTTGRDVVVAISSSSVDEDEETGLLSRIEKGLGCAESDALSTEEITSSIVVPSRYVLDIVDVRTRWEGTEGVVDVTTTQAVDPATLSGAVTIEPALAVTVEGSATGFTVRGTFIADDYYRLRVSTAIKGVVGGVLKEAYGRELEFRSMEPGIAFASSKAMYLGSRGSRALGINIVNVPRVKLTVFKIYENNILHFLREGRRYSWYDEETNVRSYDFRWIGLSDYGDTVMTREYATADLGLTENGTGVLTFDVRDHIERKGMYLVKVESTESQWVQASKIVALSDVGLIAKEGTDDLTIFANSINDAEPIGGVELTLISTNNQVIDHVQTASDGVARMEDLKKRLGNFRIGLITARHGDDFTFLAMADTRVDKSRFDVGGLHENAAGYQAFIYGERELYRPGETIHLNTIVRDRAWRPVANVPARLRILMPNGREFRSIRLTLNDQGASSADIPVPASSLTGTYIAEVYAGNDVLLATTDISVEEFLPDRIKVDLAFSSDVVRPAVPVDLTINARYFHGVDAVGRKYEVSAYVNRKTFAPRQFKDYTFDLTAKNDGIYHEYQRAGVIGDGSMARESFTLDSTLRNNGLLQARFFVTVFDETGRPVHRSDVRDVHTQPVLFGIRRFDQYTSTQNAVNIGLIASDYNAKLSRGTARLQIVRTEYHTVMEGYGEGYRYVSQKREIVMDDRQIEIDGDKTSFPYRPPMSGEYEVRISAPGGTSYVGYSFWSWGWGDTQASSFEVNTEGLVDIVLDKESYKPNETAAVLFKTPFAGKLLVTVERDGVLEHHQVQTDKRSATLKLKIKDEWTPNVYVTATLIKPHAKSDMPLTVAHGYQALMVERPGSRLPITIGAAASTRSNRKQTITVSTEPGAQLTIAVVDEGILQVRDTKTPDPHGYFYQKRALESESYDMYPFLFPELRIARMAYGAGADMMRRLNPFTAQRVTLLSYWSGILTARSGKASIDVELPSAFSGAVRVMAVAWKGSSFGSGQQTMTVADPIVISTPLPRAMTPGDTVNVPVFVSNTTSRNASAEVSMSATGPVQLASPAMQRIAIDASREARVPFVVVAGPGLGVSTITTTVKGMGETFVQTIRISVRPNVPLMEQSGAGSVKAGEAQTVSLQHSFMQGTAEGRLVVSSFPAVRIAKNLGQLLGYPYGCAEQTISKAFPQIYFADLVKAWKTDVVMTSDPTRNVQEAIRKIEGMQGYNGGITTWPGGSDMSWWTSAYSAHFLYESQKAGYEVNQRVLDRLLQFIAHKAKTYGGNKPPRDVFYSLFVLAAAGRQDVSTMNVWKSHASSLSQDSRYVLACTYLLLGDRRSYDAVVPKVFVPETYQAEFGGSFASPRRDMALSLYALVTAAPDDAQTGALARRLSESMQADDVYSTQENAFAVLALGKLARRAVKSGVKAVITRNGKQVAVMDGATATIDHADGSSYRIAASGGTVYYYWAVEGLRADGQFKEEDRTLRVRRTFLDRNGNQLPNLVLQQNDLVVVKITVGTTDRSSVDNVVITDVLPAGLELENPRLGGLSTMAWAKDAAVAQYYDYRDDRMNLFVRAEATERSYYYIVRAVSLGRFRMGPVGADAMYNDDVHSYHGRGLLVVR